MIADAIDKIAATPGPLSSRARITMLLSEAASADDAFPDFVLNDDDRFEIFIASYLHDCGKITTPDWVIDKATKLQAILRSHRSDRRTFRDVARPARGRHLAPDRRRRRPRSRTRAAGRSAGPGRRRPRLPPTCERRQRGDVRSRSRTRADYHVSGNGGVDHPLLTEDEARNLRIRRGTLLDEERQIINDHIVVTIQMLDRLPSRPIWRECRKSPAGITNAWTAPATPRASRVRIMSIPARIMGIADVFEALTAADRPYKDPMPLSQGLGHPRPTWPVDGHIDPDLYDLFLRSGVTGRPPRRASALPSS